ncbi:uncharacterized protein LOC131156065 [Malania oleifera]|uniref:uncharacterized protein LOC131156065 n=1 Tax=Malania oleifera TaxID=397392 RepID=UPI0025AE2088|nr:uncharacterized protein LOC131156065 [Malania oleifera]
MMGTVETKLSDDKLKGMMNRKFKDWKQLNNFEAHRGGRIVVLWNPQTVQVLAHQMNLKCQVTSKVFVVTFIYRFNTVVRRRELWRDIIHYGSGYSGPWPLMGDFNCVLDAKEKRNGIHPLDYKVKDFRDYLNEAGLCDLNSIGSFLTWSNGRVWCKLDRVIVNQGWLMEDWNAQARFQFPGVLSDHFVSLVSLFEHQEMGKIPFKFFNMWTNHSDFQKIVEQVWGKHYDGYNKFRLVKKLQALKIPLKKELIAKRREAVRLEEANRQFAAQVAKCRCLKNCDRGTAYFHAILKRNKTRNHIASITNQNGETTESYEQAWNTVGRDVVLPVKEFFNSGKLLKQLNHTIIALIPKSSHASNVNDFRPISCCNVVYKIISKVISTRVKPCLKELINPAQAAFVKKRSMAENIHLVQELVRGYARKRVTPRCLLKVDLRKAFDTVAWPFLTDMLKHLKFPQEMINWILGSPSAGTKTEFNSLWSSGESNSKSTEGLDGGFLWGGRRKPLVAWKDICVPKIEGGLGVVDLSFWNKALLTKTLWNIHLKKDSLWSKWMHHMYLSNTTIWEVTAKKDDSNLFKKFLEIRDQLMEKCGDERNSTKLMGRWEDDNHQCYEFWRNKNQIVPWAREVWYSAILPKHAFCLWLAVKGKLPTCDNMTVEGMDHNCTYCKAGPETLEHLFFRCNFTAGVWKKIKEWLGIRREMNTIKAAVKWLHKEVMFYLAQMMMQFGSREALT